MFLLLLVCKTSFCRWAEGCCTVVYMLVVLEFIWKAGASFILLLGDLIFFILTLLWLFVHSSCWSMRNLLGVLMLMVSIPLFIFSMCGMNDSTCLLLPIGETTFIGLFPVILLFSLLLINVGEITGIL